MPVEQPPYRIVDGVALIEVSLDDVNRLFNTLDPSPFSSRDLDAGAEDYLVGAVEELHRQHPVRLRFTVTGASAEAAEHVKSAVHHYFDYLRWGMERRIRALFREGRLALAIGLAFLIGCLTLSRIVLGLDLGIAGRILSEGLFICSWVAMWRPIEIFLFQWWPLANRKRVFAVLATIPIEVVPVDHDRPQPSAH